MFYISKIVWAFLQPSSILVILFTLGIILACAGRKRWALRVILAGSTLYLIFGFSPFANWLLVPLELHARGGDESSLKGAEAIIVLGGAITDGSPIGNGTPGLNENAGRMFEAVRLASRYPALPIVFTGGKGELIEDEKVKPEAELAEQFFATFNITPPRLRLEDKSRNTFENAVLTAKLLQPKPDQKWILVTSAYHMQRAKALFEAQGFRILPAPGDFRTNGISDIWSPFLQASEGLGRTDLAAKEWMGLLAAWIVGEIPRY